ncbi:MAG: CDP-alcohol phosphatidyltransferase family protein [Pseudomonadales bacterium]|nr:CDP-alcohol phosphatidyltransferase family protein [Pseudomonadales bacterium]
MFPLYRQIPNLITMIRIALVVPVACYIYDGAFMRATVLFIIAGISDGLDGLLARRFNWHSRFGAIADPIADKLLLTVCFLLLAYVGQLPIWLAAIVLGRDIIIFSGALAYHFFVEHYDVAPSMPGKISTFCQLLLVSVILLSNSLFPFEPFIIEMIIGLVAFSSIVSGSGYVITWWNKYRHYKND